MPPQQQDPPEVSSSTRAWRADLGAWSGVLAPLVLLLAQLVAALGWSTPYGWSTHNISDLGAVTCGPWPGGQRYVCSPWHLVMNGGFVLTGALVVLGAVLPQGRGTGWRGAARVLVALAGAAYVVAGLAPADRHENVHVVLGALPLFVLGNAGCVLAGVRRSGWSPHLRWTALLLGLAGLAATVMFFRGSYLGLGMGGLERVVVAPLLVVLLVAGASELTGRRRRRRTPTAALG